MNHPTHLLTHLQREIAKLKKGMIELSAEVEHDIEGACEALLNLDVSKANEVIKNDSVIDELEVELEEDCLKIMALYQPVAADLRMVVSILKMNNDLERMGDLAANVAEYAIEISRLGAIGIPSEFRTMFTKALNMIRKALDAVVNIDAAIAREVWLDDQAVDRLNVTILTNLRERVKVEPEHVGQLLYLISASRSIERLADYATNIAEDVYYLSQGKIIRHHMDEEFDGIDNPQTT